MICSLVMNVIIITNIFEIYTGIDIKIYVSAKFDEYISLALSWKKYASLVFPFTILAYISPRPKLSCVITQGSRFRPGKSTPNRHIITKKWGNLIGLTPSNPLKLMLHFIL